MQNKGNSGYCFISLAADYMIPLKVEDVALGQRDMESKHDTTD